MYNVYFCIHCIWFAKAVKINLQSAAQEALALCNAGCRQSTGTQTLCETWCSLSGPMVWAGSLLGHPGKAQGVQQRVAAGGMGQSAGGAAEV